MKEGKRFVLSVIIIGITALAIMMTYVGSGSIRHVEIYLPEQIRQTVAFVEGEKVELRGISGTGEKNNPTLITRSGDYTYVLTIKNQDSLPHRLYIEGLEIQTKLLMPGEEDTLIVTPKKPGTYNYYDSAGVKKLLGQLKVVQVVPSDGFG